MLPDDKAELIAAWTGSGQRVVMIGDGTSDLLTASAGSQWHEWLGSPDRLAAPRLGTGRLVFDRCKPNCCVFSKMGRCAESVPSRNVESTCDSWRRPTERCPKRLRQVEKYKVSVCEYLETLQSNK